MMFLKNPARDFFVFGKTRPGFFGFLKEGRLARGAGRRLKWRLIRRNVEPVPAAVMKQTLMENKKENYLVLYLKSVNLGIIIGNEELYQKI